MRTCFEVHEKLENYSQYQNDNSPLFSEQVDAVGGIRNIYNKVANVCINKKLMENYGLSPSTSSIDYCVIKNESNPFDIVDYCFIISFAVVVSLIALVAVYERKKHSERVAQFFERFKRTNKILNAFSVQQNWKLLIEKESSDRSDLVSLCALRVLIMFALIFTQVFRHVASLPFDNPIYVENVRKTSKISTPAHKFSHYRVITMFWRS
jgi:hypothetical protein